MWELQVLMKPPLERRHRLIAVALCSVLIGVLARADSFAEQPSTNVEASDGIAHPVALEALVDEAVRASPLIEAARHRWESAAKVPVQAATLPEPEVSLQELTVGGPRPLEGYETSDFYYTGFGVSQDIPWPAKLRLQAAEAEAESEYARQAYMAAQREVVEKVRESYFESFFLAKALAILDQTHADLQRIETIAEERYRLGQGQEQDLAKAQLEATSILEQVEMRRQEQGQRQAELKALLGRDPGSPDIELADIAPTRLALDTPQLEQLADRSPELKMAQAMEAKSAEALKLAHAGYFPDLSLGYMYQKTGPGFRDYYMLTLGAKVPLYFWRKQTPAVEQAALDSRAAHGDTRATELEVRSTAQSALIAMRTAERVMSLYRDGLIPQADATRAAALNAYRLGKVDFQTLISAVIDVLNLNQGYYRALADHEIARAKIQQIIGDVP